MRRVSFGMVSLLLPSIAVAQDAPRMDILFCVTGQGCWEGKSDLTAEEVRAVLGPERTPEGMSAATHRLVQLRGDPAVIATTMPPEMLHAAYGGKGEVGQLVMSPGDAAVREPGRIFTPDDLGDDLTIPLFDPEVEPAPVPASAGAGIVPLDGLWEVASREQIVENCGPMMEGMLAQMISAQQQRETHRIDWGGRFDPSTLDFMNAEGQRVEWTRTGPDSFTGKLFALAQGGASVSSDVGMRILAQDHIESEATLDIKTLMSGIGSAEMAALGMANCSVRMLFDIRHQGE